MDKALCNIWPHIGALFSLQVEPKCDYGIWTYTISKEICHILFWDNNFLGCVFYFGLYGMANFYANCIGSYSIVTFGLYLQGKKCADMGSYITECTLSLHCKLQEEKHLRKPWMCTIFAIIQISRAFCLLLRHKGKNAEYSNHCKKSFTSESFLSRYHMYIIR